LRSSAISCRSSLDLVRDSESPAATAAARAASARDAAAAPTTPMPAVAAPAAALMPHRRRFRPLPPPRVRRVISAYPSQAVRRLGI